MFRKKANKSIIALIVVLLIIIIFILILMLRKEAGKQEAIEPIQTVGEKAFEQAEQDANLGSEEPADVPLPEEMILEPDYMDLEGVKINRNQQSGTIPTRESLEERLKKLEGRID